MPWAVEYNIVHATYVQSSELLAAASIVDLSSLLPLMAASPAPLPTAALVRSVMERGVHISRSSSATLGRWQIRSS